MTRQLRLRLAGFCFDHMHLEGLLKSASETYEVVGVYDSEPARMASVCAALRIPSVDQFTDWERLLEERRPDVAVVCSTTAEHLAWCQRLCRAGVHVVLEKPFALSAAEAEQAASCARQAGVVLAINWPLAWYPPHRLTRRLLQEGTIGDVVETHYYGGNRGPQHHLRPNEQWEGSWWTLRDEGGGAIRDYLGYGTTLTTWFRGGELPSAVTAAWHVPTSSGVETHGVAVAEYASGLSTFQSRWGTFSDPWRHQPQPACGFTVVGTRGTILSLDYAETVRLQTEATPHGEDVPVAPVPEKPQNIFDELRRALNAGDDVREPCDWKTSLVGQKIIDAALESATSGRRIALAERAPHQQSSEPSLVVDRTHRTHQ